MIGWLRRVFAIFDRRSPDLAQIIPENPEQAATLHKADAYLASPKIRTLLRDHDDQLRGSFRRAGDRLAHR